MSTERQLDATRETTFDCWMEYPSGIHSMLRCPTCGERAPMHHLECGLGIAILECRAETKRARSVQEDITRQTLADCRRLVAEAEQRTRQIVIDNAWKGLAIRALFVGFVLFFTLWVTA